MAARKPSEGSHRPKPAEGVKPEAVELPPRPTGGKKKPGEDRRDERPPVPQGPYRPIKDRGEPTSVEEASDDDRREER